MQKTTLGLFLAICLFSACQNTSKPTETGAEETESTGTQCYELRQGSDLTAIELTLNGDDATGYYAWEPYEKDGARGMFTGKKEGDQITAIFEYMIEGSIQSEEVLFKLDGDQLVQANNELEDKEGVLMIKDKNKPNWENQFSKADCSAIAEAIDHAKEVYQMILKEKGSQPSEQ